MGLLWGERAFLCGATKSAFRLHWNGQCQLKCNFCLIAGSDFSNRSCDRWQWARCGRTDIRSFHCLYLPVSLVTDRFLSIGNRSAAPNDVGWCFDHANMARLLLAWREKSDCGDCYNVSFHNVDFWGAYTVTPSQSISWWEVGRGMSCSIRWLDG